MRIDNRAKFENVFECSNISGNIARIFAITARKIELHRNVYYWLVFFNLSFLSLSSSFHGERTVFLKNKF